MQPTRYRVSESTERYQLVYDPTDITINRDRQTYPIRYSEIADVNNGRRRPLSPCVSGRVTTQPKYAPFRENPSATGALNVPPDALLGYLRELAGDEVDRQMAIHFKRLSKVKQSLAGSYTTLNSLYELRELGSLFVDIDGKFRSLNSYRPIDYIFGVAPLISDMKSAIASYNSSAERLNDDLKRYKNYPFNSRLIGEVRREGEISFFSGNGHFQRDGITVVTRLKGTLSLGIPWLAQIDPALFKLLDLLQVDLSASNAWNAIPFSWAFDWINPFGMFLQSLPSLMVPEFQFHGCSSSKLRGLHETETRLTGPALSHNSGYQGSTFASTSYTRTPFIGSLTGITKFHQTNPVNHMTRNLVALDIFNAAKPKDKYGRLFNRLNK